MDTICCAAQYVVCVLGCHHVNVDRMETKNSFICCYRNVTISVNGTQYTENMRLQCLVMVPAT